MTSTTTTTTIPLEADPGSEHSDRPAWIFDVVVVALLGVAAAALRARALGPHSLWLDDAWVALLSRVHTVSDVRRISVASPGFVVFLKLWFMLGFSNLRAQLPAFVFGILGPPVLYVTARSWRLGRAAALLAGGLLLISPVHMRYSSRVKAFTLEALAAALILLIADRLLSEPGEAGRWYAFAVAAAVALMLSAPLVIICAPGFVAGFVALRRTKKPVPAAAYTATGLYALFSLGWYFVAIRGAIDRNLVRYWNGYYISVSAPGDFLSTTNRGLTRLAHGFNPAPAVITLLALVACLAWMCRVRFDRAVLLFGPILLAAVIAALHRNPFGGGRTDIYLYANLALALAAGANAVLSRIPAPAAFGATMAVIVGLGAVSLPPPTYPKEDFRAMFKIVDANVRPGDAILLYPKARFAAALYTGWPFHLRGPVPGAAVTTPFDLDIDRPLTYVPVDTMPVHFDSTVDAATTASRRIWYIGTHGAPDYKRAEALLKQKGFLIHLRRGFAPHYWLQLWTRPVPKRTP